MSEQIGGRWINSENYLSPLFNAKMHLTYFAMCYMYFTQYHQIGFTKYVLTIYYLHMVTTTTNSVLCKFYLFKTISK